MASSNSSWNPQYMPQSLDIHSPNLHSSTTTTSLDHNTEETPFSWNPALRPQSQSHYPHQPTSPEAAPTLANPSTDPHSDSLDWHNDDAADSEWNIQASDTSRQALSQYQSPTDQVDITSSDEPTAQSDRRELDFDEDDDATFPTNDVDDLNEVDQVNDLDELDEIDELDQVDEVDDEWNLHTQDSQAFDFMDSPARSNSFPPVPLLQTARTIHEQHPLYHSQAAEIVAQVDQDDNELLTAHDILHEEAQHTNHSLDDDMQALSISNDTEAHHPDVYVADDVESDYAGRYDEGLPLVPHSVEQDEVNPSANVERDDDDFYSRDEHTFDAPALNRKSTVQVLDNLHYEAHTNVPDNENDLTEPSEASRTSSIGNDVATSKHTILQQALDNVLADEQNDNFSASKSSADLAAQWAAALADDEFLDDDELLPDDEESQPTSLDPAALFGDDTDNFLDDDDSTFTSQDISIRQSASPSQIRAVTDSNGEMAGFDTLSGSARAGTTSTQNRYVPAGVAAASTPTVSSNPYRPAAPQFTDLTSQSTHSLQSGSLPQAGMYNTPSSNIFNTQPLPIKPDLKKTTSYAAQSKGGYQSPYDLPMDVIVPKKRQSMQQMTNTYSTGPPSHAAPPRSSSMNHNIPPRALSNAAASAPPPHAPSQAPTPAGIPTTRTPTLKSSPSFFEDLPAVTVKPRSSGRFTPVPNVPIPNTTSMPPMSQNYSQVQGLPPPSQGLPRDATLQQGLQPSPSFRSSSEPLHGLMAPPPTNPYANIESVSQPQQSTAALPSRYSPASTIPQANVVPVPSSQSKFAPPPSLRQSNSFYAAPPQTAHQPRTSSPLAQFERTTQTRQNFGPPATQNNNAGLYRRGSYNDQQRTTLVATPELVESVSLNSRPTNQPLANSSYTPLSPSKRAASNYTAMRGSAERGFVPPQRSQTQSPSQMRADISASASVPQPLYRPSSVHGSSPPSQSNAINAAPAPIVLQKTRARGLSQNFTYVTPTDGREHDPLQRWKGVPILAWGSGGNVVTSFPKHVPRYGISNTPMIVCNPGEIRVQTLKHISPTKEQLSNFPGPLRSKSKKKELLAWLKTGISVLEQANIDLRSSPHLTHEDKRREERLILWRILHVLIEYDGVLEGNDRVNLAVRNAISPGTSQEGAEATSGYATGADLSGIHRQDGVPVQAEAVDPTAVDELRKLLLRGEREKAVWLAVDSRLWAHAMLISNTVSRDLYKRVAQEFVRKEVRNIGENTEPLAALYEVFAGNFEESVDELVPASARAGFQMVSSNGPTGPQKDALDGLDRWRETLGLYLSNRSPDDAQAIMALGRLLAGYGRAEAAHTCFLFARDRVVFSGADDINANIVLLGFEHLRVPTDSDNDLESIILSEVYEYATSVLAGIPSMSAGAPHLASYKLHHAMMLAEYGQRDRALQYCDVITSAIHSQTRRSPYYHTLLHNSLEDLSKRLKSSPKDPSTSWISKPSIDKVSNSFLSKFNDFVTGGEKEDSDTQSGEAAADIGPFARIAGGTPALSRETSSADLGSYASYAGVPASGSLPIPPPLGRTASRYAPSGSYNPVPNEASLGSSYGSQSSSLPAANASDQYTYNAASANSQGPQGRYAPNAGDRYAPGGQQTPLSNAASYPATPNTEFTPAAGMYGSPQSILTAQGNRSNFDLPKRPYPSSQDSYNFPRQTPQPFYPQSANTSPKVTRPIERDSEDRGNDELSHQSHVPAYGYPSQTEQTEGQYGSLPNAVTTEDTTPEPSINTLQSNFHQEPQDNFVNTSENNGFQPLEQTGGYVPYESSEPYQEPEGDADSPINTKPRRGPMYDDDDDDIPVLKQAAPSIQPTQEKTKAEKDREADEAFRRAAEEDDKKAAAAAAAAPAKKGWGWNPFGGGSAKKETTDAKPDPSAPNKPIKAKLGEESSFVYDPELKRWVNKKAGAEDTAVRTATPPPPRSNGPPRTASNTSIPGTASAVSSRQSSGAMPPPISRQTSSSMPPASATVESSPPTSTGSIPKLPPSLNRMDSASSLGGRPPSSVGSAPPSRPGTAGPPGAKSDPMDDLLGPPTARRVGGAKGKKKARGFVDVMGDKLGS